MSYYHKNKILLYTGRAWGQELSERAKKYGFLDYATLAHGVGEMVLNNYILPKRFEEFELVNGTDYDEETEEFREFYQYYIITSQGAELLQELTDETVYYSENLDLCIWAIDHFGTAWDYVLTDVKIYKDEKEFEKAIEKEVKDLQR